ncbi:MAG: ABC transporter substrate-binding protein [Synergistaceae bacterium]|nr:ABC transporter substrate-binding protein [Synergistaceae bacterium]
MDSLFFDILKDVVAEYGTEILEEPDRLAQFLEDRLPADRETDIFRVTFALHSLIRSGWTVKTELHGAKRGLFVKKLSDDLAFTGSSSEDFLDTLDKLLKQDKIPDKSEAVVARGGNLRNIEGGIANSPRTTSLRRKYFYNGTVLLAAFAVIILLLFQISRQRNPVSNEFRIAFFTPVSGEATQSGHRQLKAAQLAVERVNKQGGVRGYKLKIVGFDVPENPAKAAEKAEEIMRDKSLLVMITSLSGESAKKLAELSDRLEIPLLLSSAELTGDVANDSEGKPYLYTFRISSLPGETARLMAYYAVKGMKARKIALLWDENDKYSYEACEALRLWLSRYGRRAAIDISYTGKDSDCTLALKTVKARGADTLLLPGNTKKTAEMLSQLQAVGFDGNVLGMNFPESGLENSGENSVQSCWLNRISQSDPQVMSVMNDYKKLYNEVCPPEETENILLVYDSVNWAAAALYKAPGYRGEAVRHGLLSTRNLALAHATLTTDPRSHGPLGKACALVKAFGVKGIFQRRISLKTGL